MSKTDLPWLFHIPDAELAESLGRRLFELGGLVIADPAHLPEHDRRMYVHTVTGPRHDPDFGDVIDVHIEFVNWSREVEWLPDELDIVAGNVYAWAASPNEYIGGIEDIPEDAPEGVADWLGLDEE